LPRLGPVARSAAVSSSPTSWPRSWGWSPPGPMPPRPSNTSHPGRCPRPPPGLPRHHGHGGTGIHRTLTLTEAPRGPARRKVVAPAGHRRVA
jgi:hypothetical protein